MRAPIIRTSIPYEPPPRPGSIAGPAIVGPAYVENKLAHRALAADLLSPASRVPATTGVRK